jgi:hypothetical protein
VRVVDVDILLVVAIAIIQTAITMCGANVSENNRIKIVSTIGGLGVLTIALASYAAYRSGKAQEGIVTGGDSFAIATLYAINGNSAHLAFRHHGDYPLHQVTSVFDDLDKYNAWYKHHIPTRPEDKFPGEHTYKLGDFPRYGVNTQGTLELSNDGKNNFLFNFVALNGYWIEFMHVRRINGKWLHARYVQWNEPKIDGPKTIFTSRTVFTDADDGYPHKKNGDIDWDY